MHINLYVPGAPLYEDDPVTGQPRFCGRSTAKIRDPFANRKTLPVLFNQQTVGHAVSMSDLKIDGEPYLCFKAELHSYQSAESLSEKLDGFLASASGCLWTSGIYLKVLHLKPQSLEERAVV